ncbi:MAG TPA: hypothetical protein VF753_16980 [Terriglobales bacterium]
MSLAAHAQATSLESGYHQMYNLDFPAAHATFAAWKQTHPEDPLGPASNAAAYLFAEFDRLHVLELDLFADDSKYLEREKPAADSNVKSAFDSELDRSTQLANAALARSPQDKNAQFAIIIATGLRGDYLALIEKRNLAALTSMKSARAAAEKLIAQDSAFYDAYLAVGCENYLLSLNAAPVRWLLRLGGSETDKQTGLNNLRTAAEKGRYLAPFARLLLAVAALRDKDNAAARALLSGLADEFPQNGLYRQELVRLR